jgi:hypothetical protein
LVKPGSARHVTTYSARRGSTNPLTCNVQFVIDAPPPQTQTERAHVAVSGLGIAQAHFSAANPPKYSQPTEDEMHPKREQDKKPNLYTIIPLGSARLVMKRITYSTARLGDDVIVASELCYSKLNGPSRHERAGLSPLAYHIVHVLVNSARHCSWQHARHSADLLALRPILFELSYMHFPPNFTRGGPDTAKPARARP